MKTLKIISGMLSNLHISNYDFETASLPYHRFNAYDYEKLLNPCDIGQEFVFKNQSNDKIKFKITKSTMGKKMHRTVLSDKRWTKNFYFDEQEIELECVNQSFIKQKIVYNIKKFPSLSKLSNHKLKFSKDSKLVATIQFPFWNNPDDIVVDYTKNISTMIIDSVFYNQVRVLESYNASISISRNVHKIYFDQQKAIVGFDDLEGNVWRISK